MTSNLKSRAKRLRSAIQQVLGVKATTSQALELVAKEENYSNWDAACACSRTQPQKYEKHQLLRLLTEYRLHNDRYFNFGYLAVSTIVDAMESLTYPLDIGTIIRHLRDQCVDLANQSELDSSVEESLLSLRNHEATHYRRMIDTTLKTLGLIGACQGV